MNYNHPFKTFLVSLGMLYIFTFCGYFVILRKIDSYYHLSFSTKSYINDIRITGINVLVLCAIAKGILLFFGLKHGQIRCLMLSQLIGMFEFTAIVVISSLSWMYEYLHDHSMKHLQVLPSITFVNIATQCYFFYLTGKDIIMILTENRNETIATVQGIL